MGGNPVPSQGFPGSKIKSKKTVLPPRPFGISNKDPFEKDESSLERLENGNGGGGALVEIPRLNLEDNPGMSAILMPPFPFIKPE